MLQELLKLELGYRILITNGKLEYGEDYVCDSDDLIHFAKNIENAIKDLKRIGDYPIAWNLNIQQVINRLQ